MMTNNNINVIYEPIRNAIPPMKASSWLYKIHPYFTRQPLNVVEEYIRHFCPANGLVLDPFCGSGVVAAAALANQRKSICLDIDPLACFITANTCETKIDFEHVDILYKDITKRMSKILNFVKIASDKEINSYELKKWYPKNVRLPLNADRQYVDEMFTKRNLIIMSNLLNLINGLSDKRTQQFFLFVFSSALDKMSIMYRAPEKGKTHGGGSGLFLVYRYWVPQNPGEKDAWLAFSESYTRVIKAKQASIKIFGDYASNDKKFIVYNDSADNLDSYIEEASVDYIFTDPPYGAHIAYLDLSTMYREWLKLPFEVSLKNKEAIEGGDLSHTNEHYLKVLSESFEKMFIALKDDAWMSLVYFHKNPNLWYSIRDMMKYIGFTYINVVAQPLSNRSFHKVKRPLRVLGESLVVNFKKSTKRIFSVPMSLPLANIIKNVAERVIYKNGGATTEEILREVVPDLFENELFIDAASKSMSDILGILGSDFDMDSNSLWQIRSERKVGNFIPPRLRIQYYVIGYLRKVKKASFDEIVTTILPLLVNGHKPTRDDILDVLREIAISSNGISWELKDPKGTLIQEELQLNVQSTVVDRDIPTEIPESTQHNQHIYRLAILCLKAGYVPFIGKRERIDPMFRSIKSITSLNVDAEGFDKKRIEQIDIIWTDSKGKPVWAFEIEESTPILSALERFTSLLKVIPELGKDRKLTIVAPRSRRKKLLQELTSSSYIGHPLFIENKVSYLFSDKLVELFTSRKIQKVFSSKDLFNECDFPRANSK